MVGHDGADLKEIRDSRTNLSNYILRSLCPRLIPTSSSVYHTLLSDRQLEQPPQSYGGIDTDCIDLGQSLCLIAPRACYMQEEDSEYNEPRLESRALI